MSVFTNAKVKDFNVNIKGTESKGKIIESNKINISNIDRTIQEPELVNLSSILTTDFSDPLLIISESNQKSDMERWKLVKDVERRTSEIQQDISQEQVKESDKMFKKWDENIRN